MHGKRAISQGGRGMEAVTFKFRVGISSSSSRRSPEEADYAEEHKVENVPEVIGDPVKLPFLIVLVSDLEVHLIGYPAHADPDHDSKRVCESPIELQLGSCLARLQQSTQTS